MWEGIFDEMANVEEQPGHDYQVCEPGEPVGNRLWGIPPLLGTQ